MQPIFIGRKSLAEQIREKYAEEPKRQETKPTTNFYDNITNTKPSRGGSTYPIQSVHDAGSTSSQSYTRSSKTL